MNSKERLMKLSVITVNYNDRDGLISTIQSIVGQTFKDYEYIIIDGGSTDGSVEVVRQNEENITYWISEPDKGIYNAMNKAIKVASGEYCIFMNSGDCFYTHDVIEKTLPFLGDTDIVYGNTHYTDGKIRYSKDEPDLFSFFYVSCWCHQSTFIKTDLLKKYFYDDSLRIVADWKFLLQTVIKDNCSFKAINQNISLYDSTGISSTNKELYEKERTLVMSEMFTHREIEDYQRLVYGHTWDEKLYAEMKHSKYHGLLYTMNVMFIKILCLFKKRSTWIDKYPIKL